VILPTVTRERMEDKMRGYNLNLTGQHLDRWDCYVANLAHSELKQAVAPSEDDERAAWRNGPEGGRPRVTLRCGGAGRGCRNSPRSEVR
jgi:hypothetical protein